MIEKGAIMVSLSRVQFIRKVRMSNCSVRHKIDVSATGSTPPSASDALLEVLTNELVQYIVVYRTGQADEPLARAITASRGSCLDNAQPLFPYVTIF